jgi:hypothetical protein
MNISPLSAGWDSKPSKKPEETGRDTTQKTEFFTVTFLYSLE